MEGFWRKKDCGISQEKMCCRTAERCLKKKATLSERIMPSHEENFLSSWLMEDGKNKEERKLEADRETKEEMGKYKG